MTKDRQVGLYRDMEAPLIALKEKFGDEILAAAYVVLTDDGSVLIERAANANDEQGVNRLIVTLLTSAAESLQEEVLGLGRGKAMGPMHFNARKPKSS